MRTIMLAATLLLGACGGTSDNAPEPVEDTASIASDLKKPLDKAAAVEQQLMENKERVDAALDEADGADQPRQR